MWRDRIAHADSLRKIQNSLPDFLHRGRIFGLHCNEAVGYDRAEEEGNPRALREIAALLGPDEFTPVDRTQLVERAEDFIRQRHHNVFDFLRHLFDVDSLGCLGSVGTESDPDQSDCTELQTLRKGYHRQLRLLISARYSGFNEATVSRTAVQTNPCA